MSVNSYQSTLTMLTKCIKVASFPGPFQHSIAKDFLFAHGESLASSPGSFPLKEPGYEARESLGMRLHKGSYTRESKSCRSFGLGY